MNGTLFSVPAFLNQTHGMDALLDDGCDAYGLITEKAATKANLPRLALSVPVQHGQVEGKCSKMISEVAIVQSLDIGGSLAKQKKVFLYIVPKIAGYDMILGSPWRKHENAQIDYRTGSLHIKRTGITVKCLDKAINELDLHQIGAAAFLAMAQKKEVTTFAVSMRDIEKALASFDKERPDHKTKLPPEYLPWEKVFDRKEAAKLPVHRLGIDHRIEILPNEKGQEPQLPWGPMYNMSREQLLVLRKTLTDLLDKGFIRVSNSPAAAPVLFVKKPGGGLRFCVDYRALNDMTKKDRYPLPLIRETLAQISRAKWFTKLDVIAAFNKIRVAEGDEWKTAFRTRYGLFEYLVTPFGLSNAPSTFQRFVNHTLREYLDIFVSAYIDDILIYTDGSLAEHRKQVKQVLSKLSDAGLQIDIDKCEFHCKKTKYLGFIIEAEKGIRMDPEKLKAIKEWEPPTTVKGVRGFIGFANFYRQFIKDFSSIVAPLVALTTKEKASGPFHLNPEARKAFEQLKEAFMVAPSVSYFDDDLPTVVECDASGWCSGGALLQKRNGQETPIAFFSKKHSPAECNYEIYDKEMLAIIRCLEEWTQYLKPLQHFTIRTDHRNLEYFRSIQKLSERQIRWAQFLSQFNFTLEYRPGPQNTLADALSRRDQDLPKDDEDDRVKSRRMQLLSNDIFPDTCNTHFVHSFPTQTSPRPEFDRTLQEEWDLHEPRDPNIAGLKAAIERGDRTIPEEYRHLSLSMSDLAIQEGRLTWRNRFWVPNHEPLRTRILQECHDSRLTSHPGKNGLVAIVARQFHWPGMVKDAGTLTRNCRACGRNTIWRTRRQGLLQPLPIPERIWSEISMDYITDLPITTKGHRHILLIVDRLSKGVIAIPCKNVQSETLAKKFIKYYLGHHGLPTAITSDRGEQFVHGVWGYICKTLNIKQRLSTAYHPATDGSTERANQTIEEVLRLHCTYNQDDWHEYLSLAQVAILGREATSIRMSPFFISHGYDLNLGLDIDLESRDNVATPRNPIEAAAKKIQKMKECVTLAQTTMAMSQQQQSQQYNRHRDPAPAYQPGDKVWLDLRNIRVETPRVKKLSELHGMFQVIEPIGNNAYRLDTPAGIHNVFNATLLRPVANDPLPSQRIDENHPPPVIVEGQEEYEVEKVLQHRTNSTRRNRKALQFLCLWKGYATPSWTDAWHMADTAALDAYEKEIGKSFPAEELGIED